MIPINNTILGLGMNTEILVINNFYNDVDSVRQFALNQTFTVKGNYPGLRTVPLSSESARNTISNIISYHGGVVTDWLNDPSNYSGSFQICIETDKTWIHADIHNTWSGVCYLSPNPPLNSGTGFYKHKETEQRYYIDSYHNGFAYDEWEQTDYVGNVYNRLVLFRGHIFHKAEKYFGNSVETGRLFQTFFFNTEY